MARSLILLRSWAILVVALASLELSCSSEHVVTDISSSDDYTPELFEDLGAETCTGMLFIDFPCSPENYIVCEDPLRFRRWETKGCIDFGYDPRCCSGLACKEGPIEFCPQGTVCRQTRDESGGCQPVECGKTDAPSCSGDSICETFLGDCESKAGGLCRSRSNCELNPMAGDPMGWVCGCDHVSYPDDCARRAARISLLSLGPCCDPAKRLLEQENSDRFVDWLACGTGSDGMAAFLKYIKDDGECVQPSVATTWGCNSGEWACRGTLMFVAGTTTIVQTQWDWLCMLAGLPGVKRIVGSAGYP